MGSGEMSVNLLDQSASLPFQELAGQTVAIDKRETVKTSQHPLIRPHLVDWPSSLSFYPTCDQCQLPQGVLSLQAQFPPQD